MTFASTDSPSIESQRRMLDDKEHTLVTMANLGEVYNKLRCYDEAEPLLADAIVTARRSLQQGH